MTDLLQVYLHDAAIGTLTMLPSGKTFFSFNKTYLHDPDRHILSQSFFRASGELIPENEFAMMQLAPMIGREDTLWWVDYSTLSQG